MTQLFHKKIVGFVYPPSLELKMTGAFIALGIIIGYFSLITTTLISTHSFITFTRTSLTQKLQESYGNAPEQFLLKNLNQKHPELEKIKKFSAHMSSDIHTVKNFFIYFRDKETAVWKKLYLDSEDILRMKTADKSKIPEIEKAELVQMRPSNDWFLGLEGKIYNLVNISLPGNPFNTVLELEIDRKSLYHLFKQNKIKFIIFDFLLLLVSSILGIIFSRRLLAPVKLFSEEAAEIAAGNYSKRFHMKSNDEIGHLSESLNKMADNIESHIIEINDRMKTMETMNQIDKAVLSSLSRVDLMDRVVGIVSSLFDTSSVIMLLYDESFEGYEILSYFNGQARRLLPEKSAIKNTEIPEELLNSTQTFIQYTEAAPENPIPDFFNKFFRASKSITNSPIFLSDQYLGSLIIAKSDAKLYSENEVKAIKMLSDQIGVAMRSVRTFEEKEKILFGILIALIKSIDAKSKWTAGHSERVAKYSKRIGIELGLNEADLHDLTMSSILHDIGKIAIPENILDKPAPLTSEEYKRIKEHPQVGADILSDIPSYSNLLPGILYHHERWDGKGYPKGLKGNDIPLLSRIIAIADVYDSVTYSRPYRKKMGKQGVVRFMKKNSGKLFDPDLVQIFLNVMEQENV